VHDPKRAVQGHCTLDTRRRRRMAVFLVVVAAVVVAYWVAWFADRSLVASATSRPYVQFEEAFPTADGWLVVCLVGGALALVRRRATAMWWLLAGVGAGVYLCAMDVTYDLEHGIWWRDANGVVELVINVATATISIAMGRWTWRRRSALAEAPDVGTAALAEASTADTAATP